MSSRCLQGLIVHFLFAVRHVVVAELYMIVSVLCCDLICSTKELLLFLGWKERLIFNVQYINIIKNRLTMGPTSKALGRHRANVMQMFCVYWVTVDIVDIIIRRNYYLTKIEKCTTSMFGYFLADIQVEHRLSRAYFPTFLE